MAVRQREGRKGKEKGAGGGESPYAKLERALRGVYDVARGVHQEQQERMIELPELGGLLVKVYAVQYEQKWGAAVFKVFKRGYLDPLCEVRFEFENGEPYAVYVSCGILEVFASRCARGEGCVLSWEEARAALRLAGWAASRLAKLAGIPAKVEREGLVEAYDTRDGGPHVFPCLQVSMNGKSYLVCGWARLSRDPNEGWRVEGDLRLVPIGEAHIKITKALMELEEMVLKYIRNRKGKGTKHIHVREYRGDFLELEKITLRRRDGAEEVLLEPRFSWLYHIGEGFTAVKCSTGCPESSDSELAAIIKKKLDEVMGKVVQACRHYMDMGDPRYAVFAYITVEALRRAGLA